MFIRCHVICTLDITERQHACGVCSVYIYIVNIINNYTSERPFVCDARRNVNIEFIYDINTISNKTI